MKSTKLLWLVLPAGIIAMTLVAFAPKVFNSKCVDGKGAKKTELREFESFHGVTLAINADVELTQGNALKVEVEAQENLMEVVETRLKSGVLHIGAVKGQCIGKHDGVTVRVTTPDVRVLSVSGSGDIKAMSGINTERLTVAISGSGDIELDDLNADDMEISIAGSGSFESTGKGKADAVEVSVSGSGDVKLPNVQSNEVEVSIAGSGDVAVWAEKALEVSIVGSGDVSYKGAARVEKSIVGSGDIHRAK